jgi:hypothetical protein
MNQNPFAGSVVDFTDRGRDAWSQSTQNGVIDYQKLVSDLLRLSVPREAPLAAPPQTRPVMGRDGAMRQEPMPAGGGAYIPGPVVSVPKRPLGTAP